MKKVGVFGNRTITDIDKVLDGFQEAVGTGQEICILHGGAAGPSKIISERAKESEGFSEVCFKPWSMVYQKLEFHPKFFYFRNKQVVENSDEIVIFRNGEDDSEVSRVLELCNRWNKKYTVVDIV
jgi:hypothetical protein